MNTQEIQDLIKEDSVINKAALDEESLRVPYIHGKWSNIFFEELKELRLLESRMKVLQLRKHSYYSGTAPEDEYILKPLHKKILKQDIDMYIDSDIDVNSMKLKISDQKLKCELVERFLKDVTQRNWHIRNAIEFLKFKNGLI